MKKLILSALLAVSMSDAVVLRESAYSSTSHCEDYAPRLRLYNNSDAKLNGFKVSAYVYNEDENAVPDVFFVDGKFWPNIERSYSVSKVSKKVHKITVDYSDIVVGARKEIDYGMFLVVQSASGGGCWSPYPTNLNRGVAVRDLVVEDLKGNVLYGRRPTFKSRVGLLTKDLLHCGNGMVPAKILLATEGNGGVEDGTYKQVAGISVAKNAAVLFFCPGDFTELPKVPYDYAVLRLDDACPSGSYPFRRHHDTRDGATNASYESFFDNDYTYSLSNYPNVLNSNADLEYCFVPKSSSATKRYPFDAKYGVFANHSATNIYHSKVVIDDEDSNNKNSYYMYNASASIQSRIKSIINEEKHNTIMHVIQWNGGSLAKATAVESSAEISTPVVAKATLAAVKDVSREAVGVDLQAAGDVEVSLVGVDGHVFAKVSASNLQPGFASLNWNAAAVPAGRYIVSVKHNGSISGKNVVLK